MLLVKEVSRVERVKAHGGESLVRAQDGARPFPDAAKLGLAGERAAVGSYWDRVPVEETGIGVAEIDEERGGGSGRWGCFLDTVIDKVSIDCWNLVHQLALLRNVLLLLCVCVNAFGLFHGRDSAAHPRCTPGKLVIRGKHGPVERISQGHQPIDCAHGLVLDKTLGKLTENGLSDCGGVGVVVVVGRNDGPRRGKVLDVR